MDPWRTVGMTKKEEWAWQHFEELKGTLLELSLCWWKRDFKSYIDKFIAERLYERDIITAIPGKDEEEEENDHIHLYGICHLVAGAVQEWELVQQPKCTATCAELDSTLVWQGRG